MQPSRSPDSVASEPFNKQSADVILRSADNVDFHVHKVVLSLASSFFESMFSLPQPSSDGAAEAACPVVEVPEDSSTLDCLLRWIYPVQDPAVDDLDILDSVLGAAMKYDCAEAIILATNTLTNFIPTRPLEVFAISCRYRCEAMANQAAQAWKARYNRVMVSNSPEFKSNIAALSYNRKAMAQRISAGCFYRLSQYLLGVVPTAFCDPLPSPAGLDSRQAAGSYPFDRKDADIIVQSSDGIDFPVLRAILELNCTSSTPPPKSLLARPSRGLSTNALPVFVAEEDGRTLQLLLEHCYPVRPGREIAAWDFQSMNSHTTINLIHATRRYGFASIERSVQLRLQELMPEDPLGVYCIAFAVDWKDIAKSAANRLASSPLPRMYSAGLELLPVEAYYSLLEYHHACQSAVRDAISKAMPLHPNYKSKAFTWMSCPDNRYISSAIWPALLEYETDHDYRGGRSSYNWPKMSALVVETEKSVAAALRPVRRIRHPRWHPLTWSMCYS